MLTTIATVLAGLTGVGVVFMGTAPFWVPKASAGFGIPGTDTDDPTFRSWLRVKAMRDIGLGLVILVVLIGGTPHLLAAVMLAATVVPAGDALIVLRAKGPKATAYGVHAATALAMLVIGALLLIA
ncbi:DUF4267 domain-containing protein [Phytomonospora endophytica]|uniref:DUF4267 domain-containing protein n=1 Tax=Phytomonospora endophytica TaxID=714109 RepID=A0A841FY63_9ACTN|nr:DUF4267 domain-containing protein [Phytomonospora endophytica]MBB6038658.1 hypothetical protein [Phytomonospora endophytica]GIG69198.1 membrane protein [Phytomonospora endophytica]